MIRNNLKKKKTLPLRDHRFYTRSLCNYFQTKNNLEFKPETILIPFLVVNCLNMFIYMQIYARRFPKCSIINWLNFEIFQTLLEQFNWIKKRVKCQNISDFELYDIIISKTNIPKY
jgi:hypothetical protein